MPCCSSTVWGVVAHSRPREAEAGGLRAKAAWATQRDTLPVQTRRSVERTVITERLLATSWYPETTGLQFSYSF